jgi:hypothetical protein
MPHRMLGAVHQTSNHRRGKFRPSNSSEVAERCGIDGTQLSDSGVHARVERGQYDRASPRAYVKSRSITPVICRT